MIIKSLEEFGKLLQDWKSLERKSNFGKSFFYITLVLERQNA
jgi:hypothetical protein